MIVNKLKEFYPCYEEAFVIANILFGLLTPARANFFSRNEIEFKKALYQFIFILICDRGKPRASVYFKPVSPSSIRSGYLRHSSERVHLRVLAKAQAHLGAGHCISQSSGKPKTLGSANLLLTQITKCCHLIF